jgi:hypothetical protein
MTLVKIIIMKHTGKIIFLQEILSIKYFIENVEIIQKIGKERSIDILFLTLEMNMRKMQE